MEYNFTKIYRDRFASAKNMLESAAIMINVFHEDFPNLVDNTTDAIIFAMGRWPTIAHFNDGDCKRICGIIRGDFSDDVGYRSTNVTINNQVFGTEPDHIDRQMRLLSTFCDNVLISALDDNEEDIKKLYTMVENIHPFDDQNGRVGGVLLSALSYNHSFGQYMLLPMQ